MAYSVIKTYGHEVGLSATFRQWRAQSHCSVIHGYALAVAIEFQAVELDDRNWVIDFGGLKELKQTLVDTFDHKTLVAVDDPHAQEYAKLQELGLMSVVPVRATGCEAFAALVYEYATGWLERSGQSPRVWVGYAEVAEHGGNRARYYRR